jgi:hypothetical protein
MCSFFCQDSVCIDGECINLPGRYNCECYDGYEMVSDACEDIDECADRCKENGECSNYKGSHRYYSKYLTIV